MLFQFLRKLLPQKKNFDELTDIADGGGPRESDDATRVRALRQAAKIAVQEDDLQKKSFDELMDIADGGGLRGIDDATRVRALRQAAKIAMQEDDLQEQLFVNASIRSFKESRLM